jgi:hypothetical protein
VQLRFAVAAKPERAASFFTTSGRDSVADDVTLNASERQRIGAAAAEPHPAVCAAAMPWVTRRSNERRGLRAKFAVEVVIMLEARMIITTLTPNCPERKWI